MRQRFYSPAILTLELDYDFKNEIYKNFKGQMEKNKNSTSLKRFRPTLLPTTIK